MFRRAGPPIELGHRREEIKLAARRNDCHRRGRADGYGRSGYVDAIEAEAVADQQGLDGGIAGVDLTNKKRAARKPT